MKLFIASDIHGSAKYCKLMIEAFERENADKLIILGDVLNHGPRNGLPEDYDPMAVAQMLSLHKNKIICVRGNCDSEVDQMVLDFPVLCEYGVVCDKNVNLYLSHGHRAVPPLACGDVYITGHTHVPLNVIEEGGYYHLNPGSVTFPKENSNRGYILYENGSFTFKTLSGEVYNSLQLKI